LGVGEAGDADGPVPDPFAAGDCKDLSWSSIAVSTVAVTPARFNAARSSADRWYGVREFRTKARITLSSKPCLVNLATAAAPGASCVIEVVGPGAGVDVMGGAGDEASAGPEVGGTVPPAFGS
jgi:hypothetical protein